MELFGVVDENGMPTGEIIERSEAHRLGKPHRTSHVWIVRKKGERVEILLQKRCEQKDSYPGCYDISSAGHIPAGDDFVESALRELKEELGVCVGVEQLEFCGIHRKTIDEVFHGARFIDRQISKVFILWLDKEAGDFSIQREEIESVRWFDFEECKEAVINNSIPHCIDIQELHLIEEHFK